MIGDMMAYARVSQCTQDMRTLNSTYMPSSLVQRTAGCRGSMLTDHGCADYTCLASIKDEHLGRDDTSARVSDGWASWLTGGRKAVRGQEVSSSSCKEQPLLGRTPPLLLGMLLFSRSRSPNRSSATAEACRTSSYKQYHTLSLRGQVLVSRPPHAATRTSRYGALEVSWLTNTAPNLLCPCIHCF